MLRLWLAMGAGVALLVGSGVIASLARAQPGADPTAVVAAYETARNRQDLEAALGYFADNASIRQRNTTFTGRDQIRKYLDMVAARAPYTVVSDRHASGNIVTWTERTPQQAQTTTSSANRLPGYIGTTSSSYGGRAGGTANTSVTAQSAFVVTVEAVVQDGKIQSMSYLFGSVLPRPDPALEGRAQLPAGIGLAAVLVVLVGVLLVASFGAGRTRRVPSSLRGHLMHDLQGWAAARE